MKVKVDKIGDGPGPTEAVVTIRRADGVRERLVVHEPSIRSGGLDVAEALARDHNRLLVELPRESLSGNWRIWVSEEDIRPGD